MGQVLFWGVHHGLGVTSTVAAIATTVAQNYRIRSLVTQPQWNDQTLEWAFKSSINKHNREYMNNDTIATGSGFDGLERAVRSSKMQRDTVKNNTLLIEPDRLDFLQGSTKQNQLDTSQDVIEIILKKANEYYDAVFLDAHSGMNSPLIHDIAKTSDLIVVCIDQNINVLQKYFADRENWPDFLKEKPQLLLISKYDAHSKYKIKNIANKYRYKGKIITVPYSSSFKDHYNDGDIKSFFSKNLNISKYDENYFFVQEVRRAANLILDEIGINTALKHVDSIEKGAS